MTDQAIDYLLVIGCVLASIGICVLYFRRMISRFDGKGKGDGK